MQTRRKERGEHLLSLEQKKKSKNDKTTKKQNPQKSKPKIL